MQQVFFWALLVLAALKHSETFNVDIIASGHPTFKVVRPYTPRPGQEISNPIFFGYNFFIKRGSRNLGRYVH